MFIMGTILLSRLYNKMSAVTTTTAAATVAANSLLKVFVYGTLKRGQPNYKWLTNVENGVAKFISTGKTTKKLPLVIGTRYNIPFLLDKHDVGNFVNGEIFEIDSLMLSKLDILEDYPEFYNREIHDIETETGKVQCWVYMLKNFPETMLEKPFLKEYKDTMELPYQESEQEDCTKEDLKY